LVEDITLKQGDTVEVTIKLTNVGEPPDEYSLIIDSGELKRQVTMSSLSGITIEPGNSSTIIVTVAIDDDTSPGDYPIVVTAKSIRAYELGLEVYDNITFTVHVQEESSESEGMSNLMIMGFSIIVIIVVLIIFIFIIMIKKSKAKKSVDEEDIEE
jgi:uncharacterized membrane protein